MLVLALLAPLLYPGDPLDMVAQPLLWPGQDAAYPLGSDSLGRDVAAGIAHGARVSLAEGDITAQRARLSKLGGDGSDNPIIREDQQRTSEGRRYSSQAALSGMKSATLATLPPKSAPVECCHACTCRGTSV